MTEYLIKWEGWDSDDNTWEPADNVGDDVIEEFEAKLKGRAGVEAARKQALQAKAAAAAAEQKAKQAKAAAAARQKAAAAAAEPPRKRLVKASGSSGVEGTEQQPGSGDSAGGIQDNKVCTPFRTQLFADALEFNMKEKFHWAQAISRLTLV